MPAFFIAGEAFACHDHLPALQLMKLAASQERAQRGDPIAALAGFNHFLEHMLLPAERPRWNAWMDEHDEVTFADLNEAAGNLVAELGGRPTVPPSPSQAGPSANGGSSNLDLSSQGTDTAEPALSMAGAPGA